MKYKFKLAGDSAELFIYEPIGPEDYWGGGVSAVGVADELKAIGDVNTINVHMNSPGGDVFDGVAIYNQFVQHKAKVNMFIDGLAASAASVIAMAGDRIHIAENAMIMIHNPWSIVIGEAADMRKMSETLEKIKETLVLTYQRRSSQMASDIARWMDEETWLTGQDAVDKGFADEVIAAKSVDNALTGRFAAHWRNAPAVFKPAASREIKVDFASDIAKLRLRLDLAKSA